MTEKPKILFIMHMPPPVHGAAMVGQYIHDSRQIQETFDCYYLNLAVAKNLEDINKAGVRKFFAILGKYLSAMKMVRSIRPDIVYITPNTSGMPFYKDYVMVQLVKHMGCKLVAHFHNKGVSSNQDRWLDDKLYRRYFRDMKLILLSEALFPDVQKYVDRDDVFFCPNGIPGKAWDHGTMVKGPNPVRILFLSNLLVEKGVIVLLDAMRILKDRACPVVCDFVGGETADLDSEVFAGEVKARGIEEMVMYHGKKYGNEKTVFIRNADMMVFPTYYSNECFPLVLLEGMEASLPCISTREGAIADIIEDNVSGLLVEKKDPQALASAIERLAGDASLRESMGKAGRVRFEKEFTTEVFEKCMCEILKEAIRTK